jgi:hypothetical protein
LVPLPTADYNGSFLQYLILICLECSPVLFVPVLTFVVGAVSVDVVGGRDDQTDASSSCSSDPKNTSSHRYYRLKLLDSTRVSDLYSFDTDPDPAF